MYVSSSSTSFNQSYRLVGHVTTPMLSSVRFTNTSRGELCTTGLYPFTSVCHELSPFIYSPFLCQAVLYFRENGQ
jgi:hypothetical protein